VSDDGDDRVTLDWADAEVRARRLTVPLVPAASKEWATRAQDLVERLGSSGQAWGKVKVSRKRISVADVADGAASDLHHLLESAALQVNTDLAEDDDEGGDDEQSDADVALTEAFRAFAPER
jgi:hypothetical protein